MEIDLTNRWTQAGLVIVALGLLLLLGRAYTPEGGRLLTWQEWQVHQLQRVHRAELQALAHEANRLADLLAGEPNPARAQVVVQSVRRNLAGQTMETLAAERERVLAAAQAVLDWASGIGDYNHAAQAVNAALDAVYAVQE